MLSFLHMGTYDVNAIYNGWKYTRKEMIDYRMQSLKDLLLIISHLFVILISF
jgi:hypothetical protein